MAVLAAPCCAVACGPTRLTVVARPASGFLPLPGAARPWRLQQQQHRRAEHCGPCFYGTGRRIAELDEKDTKEYKIARIAEVFGCPTDVIKNMVAIRPGLLLVPSAEFFKHKMVAVAVRNKVSQRQASQMILHNPTLLFEP